MYFYVIRKTGNKIKELKAKLKSFNSESLIQEKSKVVKSTPKVVINEEVNQKILDGLEEFVQSKGFLKSNITDRKSTRLNSSHVAISYAVFCLKKKNNK